MQESFGFPASSLEIICILDRLFIGVQRTTGVTAVGIRVDHRHFLIFRIHGIREPDVKIELMFSHIFTSPNIVSLQRHSPCGMI